MKSISLLSEIQTSNPSSLPVSAKKKIKKINHNNRPYQLTYEAPDGEADPGDGRQLEHEVDVDQHGRGGHEGHAGRHVGQPLGVLGLLQDDDDEEGDEDDEED